MTAVVILFVTIAALSFARIGSIRLDRPTVALVGAVVTAIANGLSLHDVESLVHWDTIFLLFGMFVLSGFLEEAGLFSWLAFEAVSRAKNARFLLVSIVFVSGITSAVLVNDTVCLLFTPFVLAVSHETKLSPLPFLLALGMGSNVGGVATYTGTPQTMIIGGLSGIPYGDYALTMAVPSLLGLVITACALLFFFRKDLPPVMLARRVIAPPQLDVALLTRVLPILGATVVAFAAGFSLAGTSLTAAGAALVVSGRDPRRALERVDWPLLVFFASLFVVTGAVAKTGLIEQVAMGAEWARPNDGASFASFSAFVAIAANLVSNVPLVLMFAPVIEGLSNAKTVWLVLALASTFAGNLTLVGSVANLIVVEAARDRVEVGFWRFLRYGSVITVLTVAFGVAWLLAFS